uniref:Uncharacterized protein n=1 Tax=Rhabditophanes sp. KR3021 TaxID=114890 RepID=A0AC35TKP3_9BILA
MEDEEPPEPSRKEEMMTFLGQIADGGNDRNAVGRSVLPKNSDQVIDGQSKSRKNEYSSNVGKELTSEERKELIELINLTEIPYPSTLTFEKDKYRNYQKTLHPKDSMFLFLREKLEENDI